jgi:hypothetical protein
MAKPIKSVEEQWEEWQQKNPISSFKPIDVVSLKETVTKNLDYVSSMDVKEYTLYQKWCEIKEKYPLKNDFNLIDFDTTVMVNPEDKKRIEKIKNNIWIPKSPDDFMDLKPVLEYTDDSKVEIEERLFGEAKVVTKRSDLPEVWNTIRDFISTMKNNSNIGRNLNFIVKDKKTNKYLGVICISSDFLDLTPRDQAIGWSRDVKTQQGMINYTAIGSTIVPFQPLGYNYMGGKLLALLCLSDTVQKLWKEKYGDVLVGVTTTSLYGMTKTDGLSQYDNLDHWERKGYSSGSVAFEPERHVKKMIFGWIKVNHPRKYFEWWEAKNPQGLPLKRDHKNRSLTFAYPKLGIPKEKTRTAHQRGIYFSELYTNTNEFLRKEITEDKLIKAFDTSEEALTNIWKTKYAKARIRQLQKKDRVSYETLFYSDLIELSWEETKAKYLPQVGR